MNYELFRTFASVMTPLISFIITYHNEPEALLKACLESILALRLAQDEAEIVVVGDGCEAPIPADLRATIKSVLQDEAGLSVARNTGISHAQGLYIQFVDADDCLIPVAYESVLEQVRKEKADIILFKASTHPSQRERRDWHMKASFLGGRLEGGSFLLHHNLRAAAWGYAFKREILGDLRFYPGLLHEDELFTPQLFLKAKALVELNVKAYFYRQHEGTITHTNSSEKVQKRLDDIRFILSELKRLDEPVLERRIRQLTVDYIQKTWTLSHSFKELRRRLVDLRKDGFLPLPVRTYSLRYFLFSLFV